MKPLFLILIITFISFHVLSQNTTQTQTIKGSVKDLNSEFPLPGVNIILIDSDPFLGTITDENGQFRLENVPPGRQSILVTYVGYKSQSIPNLLVTSGKEVIVNIHLEESVETLQEVVITP